LTRACKRCNKPSSHGEILHLEIGYFCEDCQYQMLKDFSDATGLSVWGTDFNGVTVEWESVLKTIAKD
jgi:hypothetical protein